MRKNQSSVVEHDQITLNDWLGSNEQAVQLVSPPVQSKDPERTSADAPTKSKFDKNNRQPITAENFMKECIRLVERLGHSHGRWEVFSAFIQILAVSISNQVDPVHFDEREKLYFEVIGKYSKDELEIFSKMFANLTMAATLSLDSPCDLLGPMFHEMGLHNEWNGQFFTPQYVCDMMAEMTFGDADSAMEKGYITVCEPACGSGAMLMGLAKVLQKRGLSISNMVATAIDIDMRCVCMTYIQLSLYGIPAVVAHGNSLTNEQWSCWYTPAYVCGDWQRKLYE